MICVCRPGLCVQSKVPHEHRSMGHGQCKAQEGSMICKMEKIFAGESSLEGNLRCLRKISYVKDEV